MSFDRIKYNNDFNRQNYDKVTIQIPKGEKAEWKELAEKAGMSMTEMVRRAVAEFSKKV